MFGTPAALTIMLFVGLLATPLFGAETYRIDATAPERLDAHLEYYADPTGEIGIEEAVGLWEDDAFGDFELLPALADLRSPVHWLRIRIENGTADPGTWVLDLNLKTVPLAEIFVVRDDGVDQVYAESRQSSFPDRPLRTRAVAGPVALDADEIVDVYVRFQFNVDLELEPTLLQLPAHAEREAHETARIFLFVGVMLCLASVAAALAVAVGDRAAGHYALYILSVLGWCAYMDGILYEYLWPGSNAFANDALRPIQVATTFFGALFVQSFFQLGTREPRIDRLLRVVIWISAAFAISVVFTASRIVTGVAFVFIVVAAQLYPITAAIGVARGWPGAVALLVGGIAVFVSLLAVSIAFVAPSWISLQESRDWVRLGFTVEAFAFVAAIGLRLYRLRRDEAAASAAALAATQKRLAVEEELRQANSAYQDAMRLAERHRKSFSYASHDLRQPLASLRLALHKTPSIPASDREALERSCAYLDDLVTQYLEASLEDVSSENPRPAPAARAVENVPANLLLNTVASLFSAEAEAKGLTLRTVPCSGVLRVEPMVTLRIYTNFASNAVKHTSRGGILLGCRRRKGAYALCVYDTGPGISNIEEMAQPGKAGESSSGTGLGLAVVEELAAAHALKLEYLSVPGRGSCFSVVAPAHSHDTMLD